MNEKRNSAFSSNYKEFISTMAILPTGNSCRNWKPMIVDPSENWGLGQIATQISVQIHAHPDRCTMNGDLSAEDTKALTSRDI